MSATLEPAVPIALAKPLKAGAWQAARRLLIPLPMDLARRRRLEDDTVPFKKSIAGNDLFDRAVEGEDPTLASVLIDTLQLVGASPEQLTPAQLAELLPEIERRLRLILEHDSARAVLGRLRRLVLGWDVR